MKFTLAGHHLIYEGAPHNDLGGRIGWTGTGGMGRGRCSCGELSPWLSSGAMRKQWHRDHKREIATKGDA